MKAWILRPAVIIAFLVYSFVVKAQVTPAKSFDTPWTEKELLAPADLAKMTDKPIIINIGVVEDIKGSKHIGAASEADNLAKIKTTLRNTPKNKLIVFYCGCCPFAKCPNIRPAYRELKAAGFSNIRLLNLTTNLKTDWIAKGYPLAE